jgi:hypothetical protein
MDFMFAHGGCFMNIMYGLKMISRFICAMRMFCELCVRLMCVSRHCVDITWTLNGLMGDWRMLYGLYGGFLCHTDIWWTFVYFKNVLWIVCWANLCLRILCANWCTWRISCWYFGCFCGLHLGLHYSLKAPYTFVHDLRLCISCWTIIEVL